MDTARPRALATGLLLLLATGCGRQPPKQVQYCLTAPTDSVRDTTVVRAAPARAAMGKHLQVWLRMPAQRPDLKDLRLFIDGHPIPGLRATQIGARCALRTARGTIAGYLEVHEFVPVRNDESKAALAHLLGSPTEFIDTIRVGAGFANGPEFKVQPNGDSTTVAFKVADRSTFWTVVALLALLLAGLGVAAARTPILRDPAAVVHEPEVSSPPEPKPMPPFSLAKVMMAMWTFIVLGGFFLIWLVTGDHTGILTAQALLLMGIVGVSAAASAAITRNQNEPVAREDRQLRRQEAMHWEAATRGEADRSAELGRVRVQRAALRERAPGYRGFFTDILSDANGPSLHRFQNLAWHLTLVIIFINGTYRALAFPELDGTLLALLGISETMYLGLKLSEPPKPPATEPEPEAA